MAITAHRFRRVEVWSNWQGGAGARQIVIPDVVGLSVTSNVLATDKLTLTLPTNSIAAPFINSGSIVRVDQDDAFTNLLFPSEDFTSASWTKQTGGAGSLPVVTADQAIAPDGTLSADKVVFAAPASGDQSLLFQDPVVITGQQYTGSIYVKAFAAGDVGKQIILRHVGDGTYGVITLSNDWQRFATSEVANNTSGNISFGLRPVVGGGSAGTVSVFIWGAMLNTGGLRDYAKTTSGTTTVDAVYDEWKIVEGPDDDDVTGMRSCVAAPIRQTDMATCDIVRRIDSDGTNVPDFESVGLTPALHISTWIIPALTRSGLTFVVAGTIVPAGNVDMTYAWDSPLSALTRLAEVTSMELDIRRTPSGYAIDLIPAIGSSAPIADVRLGRNLVNLRRTRVASEQVTRVFPRGMQTDNAYATMSRATWRVSVVAGSVITLVDPAGGAGPIQFDGQLAGTSGTQTAYLRKIDGTLTAVTASSAAGQTVTVASATGITVGDLIQFRADSSGNDLLSMDSPPDWASYGLRAATFDVPDVPATNNLLKNSTMRAWPGSSSAPPTNWTAVGAPTIAKQTAGPFTLIGGNSIHVTATLDGTGVISDAVPLVGMSALNPYVSGFARVWGVSGQFRVELVFTIPSGTTVMPVLPDVASNTVNGQFVDLGLSGIDAVALGATAVQLRIVQHGTVAAEFYVDAGQIALSDAQLPFVEGSGGTRLWQAANDRLRQMGSPLISYEVPIVDLAAMNPTLWAADTQLAVGGQVRVTDTRLGLTIVTRLMELQRDYKTPGNTKITLSNKPDDVTGTLARPPRPARQDILNPTLAGGPDIPVISYTPDIAGNVSVAVTLSNNVRTVRAAVSRNDIMPSAATVDASAGQAVIAGSGRFAFGNLLTGLVTGDRYNVAVRAYDAAGVPSDLATLSDVYISGVNGTQPAVIMGTPIPSSTSITFPITPNLHTTNFEIYVKEYDADPGTLVDVDSAYATPYDDIVVGAIPARAQAGAVFNYTIPIGAATNYLMITVVPYNAYLVGTKGRAKSQGSVTAPPAPPTARANVSHTPLTVTNSVTMPATAPGFIRVYRDNVFIQDIAVTVGGGAVQTLTADTGLTPSTSYTYTYSSVTAGVESTTRTAPLIVTTDAPGGGGGTLPTPSLAGSYDYGAGAFVFTITPGDGTTGVTWHIERSTTTSGGVYSEVVSGGSTSLQIRSPQTGVDTTWYFKAWGTKTGYTDSPRSAFVSVFRLRAGY